jgi:ribA/ribD-fused uncharacterized protein
MTTPLRPTEPRTSTPRIESFHGEYRFLSNFWPAIVEMDGIIYPTVEHAYQAAKTFDQSARLKIQALREPGNAKRAGRRISLRPDWEAVKLNVMLSLLRSKFAEKSLADKLLATGDYELLEGNEWGDTFWGVCRGIGHNHLGKLLMQVRKELTR